MIVAAQPDSGTFIASLSNNSPRPALRADRRRRRRRLERPEGRPRRTSRSTSPPRGFVNLVDEDPITVTGDFDAGQVAELTLTFDSGDTVTMDVPIVYACDTYAGLDPSQQQPDESESASRPAVAGDVPTEGTTVSPSASPSESDSSAPPAPQEPYDCVAVGEG